MHLHVGLRQHTHLWDVCCLAHKAVGGRLAVHEQEAAEVADSLALCQDVHEGGLSSAGWAQQRLQHHASKRVEVC